MRRNSRLGWFVWLAITTTAAAVVVMALSGCGNSGDGSDTYRPAPPGAFQTALVFPVSPGPDASSPACDAAVMKAAQKEGELRAALFECETFVHFINAVSSYPAALGPEGDAVEWLIQTCFRVSAEEYSRSGVCQFIVARGTPTR